MTTRVEMIIETLRENPERTFTARELAEFFISRYPAEMEEKQKNPRYKNHNELVTQLAAEIGGSRTAPSQPSRFRPSYPHDVPYEVAVKGWKVNGID